jgi:hypothetical protein
MIKPKNRNIVIISLVADLLKARYHACMHGKQGEKFEEGYYVFSGNIQSG